MDFYKQWLGDNALCFTAGLIGSIAGYFCAYDDRIGNVLEAGFAALLVVLFFSAFLGFAGGSVYKKEDAFASMVGGAVGVLVMVVADLIW
jgi:hypothetical protein